MYVQRQRFPLIYDLVSNHRDMLYVIREFFDGEDADKSHKKEAQLAEIFFCQTFSYSIKKVVVG